ncbi:MAG TPA: glycosyltransferase family 4 protein [Candidatus Saccharimonadales bacterium]|nr:glycosyltransferase family 4 protein [Candidatus Saccharimonadales bacterium]
MKILFIADILPDLHSGSAVRNYYLLASLSKKYSVDFVGLTDNTHIVNMNIYRKLNIIQPTILERRTLPFFVKLFYLLRGEIPYVQQRKNVKLPKHIITALKKYDYIHLAELNSYFLLEKYMQEIHVPIVLDAHNVEYIRFSTEIKNASLLTRYIGNILSLKLKKLEIQAIKRIEHLSVCSLVDKEYFQKYIPKKDITVIPNGVNVSYYNYTNKTIQKKNNIVLFMGLLSYFPNDEGLQYYFSEIHPAVKTIIKNYEFHIIGKDAQQWLKEKAKNDTSIKLFGFVNDTRQYIAKATICIAPLLSGSGTRLKILEYMAMRKAIVATPKSAEGIEIKNEKNILIAKNTNEFIQSILKLFNNQKIRDDLGINAEKLIKDKYDWDSIGSNLNNMYEHLNN